MLLELLIDTLPDPVHIVEKQSVLVIVSLFLGCVSSLAVIVSAIVAYREWGRKNADDRMQLLQDIRSRLFDDPDVIKTIYMFDYDDEENNPNRKNWYDGNFHNTQELQMIVDKTLSIFEYVCFLSNKGKIGKDELDIVKYRLDRVLVNVQVQAYLFNLYHWCKEANSRCSFQNLIEYGTKEKMIGEDFYDEKSEKYPHYLC